MKSLTETERAELADCEDVLAQTKASFVDAGRALERVRVGRLYRAEFRTFDAYCSHKWSMSKTHANRLIETLRVMEELTPMGVKNNGLTERAVRPLTRVPSEDVRGVYEDATESAKSRGESSPSVRDTTEAVERYRDEPTDATPIDTSDGMTGFRAFDAANRLAGECTRALRVCARIVREGGEPGGGVSRLFDRVRELTEAAKDLGATIEGAAGA